MINIENKENEPLQKEENEPLKPKEIKRGKIIAEIKFPTQFFGLFNIRYSPDGNNLVSTFGQGAIQVRHPDTGETKRTIRSGGNHSYPVQCVRFNPLYPTKCYAASSCGSIFICDLSRFDYSVFATENRNEVNSLDISYDGLSIATGGKDTIVRVYDTHTAKLKVAYGHPKGLHARSTILQDQRFHLMRVYCTKFNPRFKEVLITGGWDDNIMVWDFRDPSGCVRKIYGPHICGDSIDIKDRVLLTGSWAVRNSLQIWDFGSGELIDSIAPVNRSTDINGEFLYACQYFHGDVKEDLVVVGGSGTGFVEGQHIWKHPIRNINPVLHLCKNGTTWLFVISLKDKLVLGSFKSNKPCQTLDSYQNKIIYGGMESFIRIVEFNMK